MSRAESRSQMMDKLGAVQLNTVWSWCAVNDKERKIYFSAWVDSKIKINEKWHYVVQEQDWGVDEETGSFSAARNDQDKKFQLVFEEGYDPYLYFIEAEDTTVIPRTIKSIRTSFVFGAVLSRMENGDIIALPTKRIELE